MATTTAVMAAVTMTEATKGKPKRRPSAAPVFLGSLVLFCVLFGLIAYRAGSGFSADAAAVSSPAPQRKLVIRRVVTTVVPGPAATTSAPVEAEAAPVETAPVEPAPVVTSSS
jgi:hypothetical protein